MKNIIKKFLTIKRIDSHKVLTICGIKIKYKCELSCKEEIALLRKTANDINFKQNLIMDYFLDARNALPAKGALRKRQLDNIELLKEFKRICDKHNINYWLDYGSLLGAKRHGGYVPWDDDLDVSMDKESLEKFKKCLNLELNPIYEFKFYCTCYNRLLFKDDNGAFLDIYEYACKEDRYRVNEDNPVFFADKLSTPKNILFPLSEISFENIKVKCPHDVDTYLRIKYGNYELLPKKGHEVPGHNSIQEYKIFYKDEK